MKKSFITLGQQQFAIYNLQFAICNLQFAIYNLQEKAFTTVVMRAQGKASLTCAAKTVKILQCDSLILAGT